MDYDNGACTLQLSQVSITLTIKFESSGLPIFIQIILPGILLVNGGFGTVNRVASCQPATMDVPCYQRNHLPCICLFHSILARFDHNTPEPETKGGRKYSYYNCK